MYVERQNYGIFLKKIYFLFLKQTLNDVITGAIFLGTRLYMQTMNHGSSNLQSTALVLLNTRDISGYKSVKEMVKPHKVNTPLWGNQFGFLHIPVPELNGVDDLNPVDFVFKAQRLILKKRSSLGVHLTGWLLEILRKYRGPEVCGLRFLFSPFVFPICTMRSILHFEHDMFWSCYA